MDHCVVQVWDLRQHLINSELSLVFLLLLMDDLFKRLRVFLYQQIFFSILLILAILTEIDLLEDFPHHILTREFELLHLLASTLEELPNLSIKKPNEVFVFVIF